MARILIVGCGGRGQALARSLREAGHALRGATRTEERFEAIRDAGAEPYLGDPDRIASLMDGLIATTIVVYLMGSAEGDNAHDLHAGRLRMLCEKVVDTPVRGLVYEAAGTVGDEVLRQGEAIVRDAHERWNIPVEIVTTPPDECPRWTADMTSAVGRLLSV
jgi:uncharacterized protein YbjT (DUF2867 family)